MFQLLGWCSCFSGRRGYWQHCYFSVVLPVVGRGSIETRWAKVCQVLKQPSAECGHKQYNRSSLPTRYNRFARAIPRFLQDSRVPNPSSGDTCPKDLFFVLGLLSSQSFGAIPKWFLFGWEGSAIWPPTLSVWRFSFSGFDQQGGHSTRGFQGDLLESWVELERMDGIFPTSGHFFRLNSWMNDIFLHKWKGWKLGRWVYCFHDRRNLRFLEYRSQAFFFPPNFTINRHRIFELWRMNVLNRSRSKISACSGSNWGRFLTHLQMTRVSKKKARIALVAFLSPDMKPLMIWCDLNLKLWCELQST